MCVRGLRMRNMPTLSADVGRPNALRPEQEITDNGTTFPGKTLLLMVLSRSVLFLYSLVWDELVCQSSQPILR
ncbi:hypothetical protein SBC1_79650 (plasmid) [Caballeronia sp. SBC1]|nr:hypothetical protein SBC1_79650 [Caballeronia sp. SBC1]